MYVKQDNNGDESSTDALHVSEVERLIDNVYNADASTKVLIDRMQQVDSFVHTHVHAVSTPDTGWLCGRPLHLCCSALHQADSRRL